MRFGYFTLSDNHYQDNQRIANELIADIIDEAVCAEQLGSTRHGSASTISALSACCPAPIWRLPSSPRAPGASGLLQP